jgi:hypothetical protein
MGAEQPSPKEAVMESDGRTRSGRRTPLAIGRRSVRRFGHRSRPAQLRTLAAVMAVVCGLGAYLAAAPASTPGIGVAGAASNNSLAASLSRASTSTRGIVGNKINVVFPVVSLNSLAGKEGFAEDYEFSEQDKAIKYFVGLVNQKGIHGKKINPIIVSYDPTNEASMRALCKDWTEGSPAAFAVIDGVGTWTGDDQLCITQEGHTPLISAWSTVTNWTQKGAPYLWWTGADDAAILQAVVNWGLSAGLLGYGHKVGIVAGDRSSDQTALNQYLLPDLRRAGVTPTVETLAADPSETAETNAEAPLVVQKFKSEGVTDVIPLIPFNAMFPFLGSETSDNYFPKLLLSDYEESISASLGLIPTPYEKALNGQQGVTTETLGGVDDSRPESQGGYDPGVRSCFTAWHKKYPQKVGFNHPQSYYIEEQGPVQSWCTAIRLFATAANGAGSDLNRRTFVEAMSRVKNFPGGISPVWSFGPNKFYGPTKYQVVEIHNNVPPSSKCKLTSNGIPQGTCWVQTRGWQPLPTVSG